MVYLIALIFLILILLFMLNFEYYRHKLGVSTSHSAKAMRQAIVDEIRSVASPLATLKIVDPGCGSGGLARYIARNVPNSTVVGLELSPLPFWQSTLAQKIWGPKNVVFYHKNFFEYDFSDVDVVVTFLPQPVLHKLAAELQTQMNPGGLILCNAFEMPQGWAAYKKQLIQPVLKRFLFCYRTGSAR